MGNKMISLGKKVGLWDNAQDQSEKQQVENTIGEIERCLNKDTLLHSMIQKKELEYVHAGSVSKGTATAKNSDVDLQVVFNSDKIVIEDFKEYVYKVLVENFGVAYVKRKNVAMAVLSNINRIDADVVVAKKISKYRIDTYADNTQEMIEHYSKLDKEMMNNRNSITNSNYIKMVRAYKALRNDMRLSNIQSALDMSSFKIECCLYNVKSKTFNDKRKMYKGVSVEDKFEKMFQLVAKSQSASIKNKKRVKRIFEVNRKKELFVIEQSKTSAAKFFDDVIDYINENYLINMKI